MFSLSTNRGSGLPALMLLLVSFALVGCTCSSSKKAPPVRVLSASVFTDALEEIGQRFEAINPDTRVVNSFAGSQVLRYQIEQGAPADIFVSGHKEHIAYLEKLGLVQDTRVLAYSDLVLIVPLDNPAGIKSFEDLPLAKRIVIGEELSPVGLYTAALLQKANSHYGCSFKEKSLRGLASRESNVGLVRAKVQMGEADAAIVYRNSFSTHGTLEIPIPDEINVRGEYYMGFVGSKTPAAAAWVEEIESDEGRAILKKHAFIPASTSKVGLSDR